MEECQGWRQAGCLLQGACIKCLLFINHITTWSNSIPFSSPKEEQLATFQGRSEKYRNFQICRRHLCRFYQINISCYLITQMASILRINNLVWFLMPIIAARKVDNLITFISRLLIKNHLSLYTKSILACI